MPKKQFFLLTGFYASAGIVLVLQEWRLYFLMEHDLNSPVTVPHSPSRSINVPSRSVNVPQQSLSVRK